LKAGRVGRTPTHRFRSRRAKRLYSPPLCRTKPAPCQARPHGVMAPEPVGWVVLRPTASAWQCEGPVPLPSDWPSRMHKEQSQADLERLHTSVARRRPFGEDKWMQHIARRLGLESSLRPVGRTRIREPENETKSQQ